MTCHLDWKQYIEPYHTLPKLYEMWQHEFSPIPHQSYWTFPLANNWERYGMLVPNEDLRKKRKKRHNKGQSQRIHTEMDNSQIGKTCGKCGQQGHTRRSARCPQKDL
ncbi:hypothetical protein DCAR_0831316 [Daucus carota subsp. sativus]|uniref:Zinc knuckle domain-containing protein n=1 Tax=Daucus carota subsp. sativus TaxID=79200 RepID=A0AAF0XPF2_DAUCS|nr:hypothetical protein DCAR_0831316 [Daucus carota subsp. sativus]